MTVAEDAIAIAPFALVKRLRLFRWRPLKHDASHGTMVEITQRREFFLWMMVHDSSVEEFTPPIAIEGSSKMESSGDWAGTNDSRRFPPRCGKIGADQPD